MSERSTGRGEDEGRTRGGRGEDEQTWPGAPGGSNPLPRASLGSPRDGGPDDARSWDCFTSEPRTLDLYAKFPENIYKHFVAQKGEAWKPNVGPQAGRGI